MKVVFLDIDGVLNCNSTTNRVLGYDFVDDDKVDRLKHIIDETGAKVVLSSTWREGWYDFDNGRAETISADLFVALERRLLESGIEMIDKTPMFRGHLSVRGQEIKHWIEHCDEDIEAFVILEDWESLAPYNDDNIVWTDDYDGLTDQDAEAAIKILNRVLTK